MADTKSQLSFRDVESFEDVDIWVILLDGFGDISNVEFATRLGISQSDIRNNDRSITVTLRNVSLRYRFHLLPFYVVRKSVVMVDASYLAENYKRRCLDEMLYLQMIGQRDQDLWDRCKVK